jgi:hypothetical protein
VISSSQRLLPDNTQHSQQTEIHALGGIRTDDLSRRAASDPRLRLRGNWDRQGNTLLVGIKIINKKIVTSPSACTNDIESFGKIQHTFFPVGFSEDPLNEICPFGIHDLILQ